MSRVIFHLQFLARIALRIDFVQRLASESTHSTNLLWSAYTSGQ